MELEKLKALRKKIPISIKEAIDLLNKHDQNIAACEKAFHKINIESICTQTECAFEKAHKYYRQFNFNKAKAIKAINNEQSVFTIGQSKVAKNATGFILWFEDENGQPFKSEKRNDVFIPTNDFDCIKATFQSNSTQSFDIRGDNYFNKTECKSIIEGLEQLKSDDPNRNQFLNDLMEWINENLKFADALVVYGNL